MVIASGIESAHCYCFLGVCFIGDSSRCLDGSTHGDSRYAGDFSNRPRAVNNNPNAVGDRLFDLMAPGNDFMSSIATTTTSYDDYPGTSMAAPHVAGAWAVLKGISRGASVTQVLV
jgi:subtilisin family serine protease